MTTLTELWKERGLGKSIKLSRLCEITQDPYTRLIIRPDSTISNMRNKELAAMVADMWRPFARRWTVTDKHICYNNLPRCVYELHMDRGKISFSLSVPEGYGQQLLRRASAIWDRATITAEQTTLRNIDPNNLTVLSMQYKRTPMYSLHIHRDIDVLKSWLEASNCLIADDWARIIVHTTPMDRLAWQQRFRKQWAELRKGVVPPEGNGPLTMIAGTIRNILHETLFGFGELMGKKPESNHNYTEVDTQAGRMAIARLSGYTKRKVDNPVLQARIWVASHSKDETRSRSTAQLIAAGFGDMAGDNELIAVESGKKPALKWLTETNHPILNNGLPMSHEEIGQLWRLPGKELQDQYLTIDAKRQREVTLPEELFQAEGLPLGKVTERGVTRLAGIPWVDDDITCRSWAVLGMMGTGKTTVGGNTAVEFVKKGYTAIMLDMADGTGIDKIRDGLPADFPDEKVIDLDFGNIHWPVPLDMSDVAYHLMANKDLDALQQRRTANKLTDYLLYFIQQLDEGKLSDRMEYYATAAGRAVLGTPGRGLADMMMVLTSPTFRAEVMEEIKESQPDVWETLQDLQDAAGRSSDKYKTEPLLDRLSKLTRQEELAFLFLQEPLLREGRPVIDFRDWIDNPEGGPGYFIGLRVPKAELGKEGTRRVAGFLTAKLWLATLSRIDTPEKLRRPYCFIADEPHNFLDAVGSLLDDVGVEARKYRAKMIWLAHGLAQFGDHYSALASGGCQLTCYKTENVDDLKKLANRFKPYKPEEVYQQLPKRWAAINKIDLPKADEVPAFIAQMLPPPPLIKDRSYRRQECSREYGRHWKDVALAVDRQRKYFLQDEGKRGKKK